MGKAAEGRKLPLTGEQPGGKAWPRKRPWKTEEGSSGSDTIALCTAAEGHASMQSLVLESSRYREGVGMPFQVRTTHLGAWGLIHHQRDIKAQGDCGASEHLKGFLSFT